MHRGYWRVWRKWVDHPVSRDTNAWHVMSHLCNAALVNPAKGRRGGYSLEVGESDLTHHQLELLTGLTSKAIRSALTRLVTLEVLTVRQVSGGQRGRNRNVYKLRNYAEYNGLAEPKGTNGDDERAQMGTGQGQAKGRLRAGQGRVLENEETEEHGDHVDSKSAAQTQDAPIGLESAWSPPAETAGTRAGNSSDGVTTPKEPPPAASDPWADFETFMAALPKWRNRGPKRPMGVRQWFEGQAPPDRAVAVQFARDFAQWAGTVPSSRLDAIPGPMRLVSDGWDLEAVVAASKPMGANRETKLVGQIAVKLPTGEEIAQSWGKEPHELSREIPQRPPERL